MVLCNDKLKKSWLGSRHSAVRLELINAARRDASEAAEVRLRGEFTCCRRSECELLSSVYLVQRVAATSE